jgi:tRNA(fMet)-specific endonuclease VapC
LSAKFYADLRTQGTPVDDIDLLIADIALANNLILMIHNVKHFDRIEGLEITDWSEG